MANQELQKATSNQFLTTYSPKALLVQFRGVNTVMAAIDAKSESLMELARTYSIEKVAALIKLQLIQLNEILDLKRPLGETAIELIAEEVITTYKQLTLADIHLIFKRALTGHYGEYYESITTPKVLTWFRLYFDERCEVYAERSLREHSKHNTGMMHVSVKTAAAELASHKAAHKAYQLQKFEQDLKDGKIK